MKNRIKYIGFILAGMLSMTACTDQFENYNTNPIGITDEELKQDFNHIGAYFPAIEEMIYCNYNWGWGVNWPFQVMQNLNADIFSGYMTTYSIFGEDKSFIDNRNYALKAGWNDANWDYTYDYLMPNTLTIKSKCNEDYNAYGHFDAVNKILKVLAMSRLCDQYGPIIYSKYGESKTGGTYDSAQDAYKSFIQDLKDAVEVLNNFVTANPGAKPFARFDMAYEGDYTKWIKFANTLHLRLAMRQVKYNAELAKTEALAAVNAPQGIISANAGNFTISGRGFTNPLAEISTVWDNIHLNANVESILGGYNDPRLAIFAKSASKSDEIKGMRNGINLKDGFATKYVGYISQINVKSDTKPVLMTAAEAHFLLAEAALRGWDVGGDAETHYENGVRSSFDQFGVPLSDYLERTLLPQAYVDKIQPAASAAAVSKIAPQWDNAATNEQKLERIITQKWIASFPEGMNSWAEYRRTGYPVLFPNTENYSDGIIDTQFGIRRLPFSSREKTNNAEGYADAVQKLGPGAADNGATRLFWDINKGNF